MATMTFKKIKFDGSTVTIEQESAGGKWERSETLTSREQPHPDFVAALAAFAAPVLALCELPEEYEQGLRVQSVSLSRDDDGNQGCVITSLKKLETVPAPLVLNTPHVSEREDANGRATMPSEVHDALQALIREARLFMDGKRAQGELFQQPATDGVQRAAQRLRDTIPAGGSVTITAAGRSATLHGTGAR